MKKISFSFLFIILSLKIMAQNNTLPTTVVIGLPKISHVQLGLIKNDFEAVPEIKTAEFVFNDNVMLIEGDEKATNKITIKDIEKILKNYFNVKDIHEKEVSSFKLLKAEYNKVDKYILK